MPSFSRINSPIQAIPAAGALTDVFTVPLGFTLEISSGQVCNQIAGDSRFWISVALKGVADTPAQYIYFNVPIEGWDAFKFDIGLNLNQGDVLRAKSDTGSVSFAFFGSMTSVLVSGLQ
jgi:hypothetical protein